MKYLQLHVPGRGYYRVNEQGRIMRCDMPEMGYCEKWLFLGVSTHHWHRHIAIPFAAIWENPGLAVKGIVWDFDHGTTRMWGGGPKTPRIASCVKYED